MELQGGTRQRERKRLKVRLDRKEERTQLRLRWFGHVHNSKGGSVWSCQAGGKDLRED